MLRRPSSTPLSLHLVRLPPTSSTPLLRQLSLTPSLSKSAPWSYQPPSRHPKPSPDSKWKKDQTITFSHGFVHKEHTPSPARQPPQVAPYGPGSGMHTDPLLMLGPGGKADDLPVVMGASRYGRGEVLGSPRGRAEEEGHGRVGAPEERKAVEAPRWGGSGSEGSGMKEEEERGGFGFKSDDDPYKSEQITEKGFRPATSFTSGGFVEERKPPRNPRVPGSLREMAAKVRREGPVLRSQDPDSEQLPSREYFTEAQRLRAAPPSVYRPRILGRQSDIPLSAADKYARMRRAQRDQEEDSALMETEPGEDDEEAAAWREAEEGVRNSDISVSMDFEPTEIDPEAVAAARAKLGETSNPVHTPAPRPYSTGFNFAPIPGDDGPSNIVPANKIVPNYDPTGWAQLPAVSKTPAAPVPLLSPRYELPSIVSDEWKGDNLDDRFAGHRQGGGLFHLDNDQPLVPKKRKGEPLRPRSIPHPSLSLGYTSPMTQMLSPAAPVASSSSLPAPAEFDPNDPQGQFAEMSMDTPSPLDYPVSSDPLLRPWSYTPPLLPSQIPPKPKPAPPIIYPGAPRHPSIQLPAWSLRKAAHLKREAENSPDGSTHWNPTRKLSRDKMDEIKRLAKEDPERWNMKSLSEMHDISPEAIRRILRSKWSEKDETEWEGLIGGGGNEKDAGSWMNHLEVDAEEMARQAGGGWSSRNEAAPRQRQKISEDDPFGDIDEIDESEWKLAGGSRMEEEFERKEREEERLEIEAVAKEGLTASTSTPSTSADPPSSPSSSSTATAPRRKSLLSSYGRKLLPADHSAFPPPSPTTTPPSSTGRTRHDSRLANPNAWVSQPRPSSSSSSSSSLLSSLPSQPPSPSSPSPFAAAAQAAKAQREAKDAWAERQKHFHMEERQARIHAFRPDARVESQRPASKLSVPSETFDGRRKKKSYGLVVGSDVPEERAQVEVERGRRREEERGAGLGVGAGGGGGKMDWARKAEEAVARARGQEEEVWGRNAPRV